MILPWLGTRCTEKGESFIPRSATPKRHGATPTSAKMYFEAIKWVLGMTEGSTASHPRPQMPGDQH